MSTRGMVLRESGYPPPLALFCSCLLILIWAVDFPHLVNAQSSIIDVVSKSKDSFVDIKAVKTSNASATSMTVLEQKTGRLLISERQRPNEKVNGGAGVIIDPAGIIVTDLHILIESNYILVTLADQSTYNARIIYLAAEHDLALLKIDVPYPLTSILLADSNQVNLKDPVINVGNSEFREDSLCGGYVQALGKNKQTQDTEIIQAHMDLARGDSGGPLLNKHGELIGLITAQIGTNQKMILAVPSNKIKKLYLESLP